MKFSLVLLGVATAFPFTFPGLGEKRLIKTAPDQYEVVSEATKLSYRRDNKKFIDVTGQMSIDDAVQQGLVGRVGEHLSWFEKLTVSSAKQLASIKEIPVYNYPKKVSHKDSVEQLFEDISTDTQYDNLASFSSFYTRYYKSDTGYESAQWLYAKIHEYIAPPKGAKEVITTETFAHEWKQFSIAVRIPGKSTDKIVVGAHQDSINLLFPGLLRAPGADDDGSGTITTLEALRLLAKAYYEGTFVPHNTLEFHYYSAEEGGLLGLIDVFTRYADRNETVLAMLQQDMTGYTAGSVDKGVEPHFGLISDYVSANLNDFIKVIIDNYNSIPYHETSCGYACSDHASALENGYPSSFLIESEFKYTSKYIHSVLDTIDRLDFDHIKEHTKLTIAFAYELASAKKINT